MFQIKENREEWIAVRSFKAKLAMAKLNATRSNPSQALPKRDVSGHLTGEFDISGLPLKLKKHIITAGIIQGDIFDYGDGFACIREGDISERTSTTSKVLLLQVQANTLDSYAKAISAVETLVDEVLEPQKKIVKHTLNRRSWGDVMKNDYEIHDLIRPVVSHLITKGIIKGDLYCASGAVVCAKGSPYLADDLPPEATSEGPIYLLIQGPNDRTLHRAALGIRKLITEAEEIINNDAPEVIAVVKAAEKEDLVPVNVVDLTQDNQYPPFLPQLGEGIDADVTRCLVMLQWLLAHPLFVSFVIRPPSGCEAKTFSRKMVSTALFCLQLYDQYKCRHSKTSCNDCLRFFSEVQSAAFDCCQRVLQDGYDISTLILVDDYIKRLSIDPTQIGVLYDYPLPMNLFDLDRCRLFIDVAIDRGLKTEESHIVSYLKSTNFFYPVKAYQKITTGSQVNPCPSKNRNARKYPSYCSLDHHGGLINFHLSTINNASPQRFFFPDAPKIPKCDYFPLLRKLTIFSNLSSFTKKNSKKAHSETVKGSSMLHAAYDLAVQSSLLTPQTGTHNTSGSSQNVQRDQGNEKNESSKLPVSFSTLREPSGASKNTPNPNPTPNPSRILRKQIRKGKLEMRLEEKKAEVNKTMEQLKEKYGTNHFWTADPSKLNDGNAKEMLANLSGNQTDSHPQSGSSQPQTFSGFLRPPNIQNALSMMQTSMPIQKPNVFGTQTSIQGGNAPLSLNSGKQPEQTDAQGNEWLGVISQLQEFIQGTNKNATQGNYPSEFSLDEDIYAEPQESEITYPPLTIPEKTAVDNDSPQEGVLSSIIEQLQNFIHSNNQTKENPESEMSPKDVLKNPSVSGQRTVNEENRASSKHLPEQSQHKRVADSTTDAPQQKQPRIETTNNNPSTTSSKMPDLKLKNSENAIKPPTNQGASQTGRVIKPPTTQGPSQAGRVIKPPTNQGTSQAGRVIKPPTNQGTSQAGRVIKPPTNQGTSQEQVIDLTKQLDIVPEVSILGDSMLQRARSQFGGSRRKDCREDHFTMQHLLTDVMNFYSERQRLNHFCVLMCGVNDIFTDVPPVAFNQMLKKLINFLLAKGHYIFLVTIPNVICSVAEINKKTLGMNGFLLSYHTKAKLSIIPFHKKFLEYQNRKSLFHSIRETTLNRFTVLSDIACTLIREMIEEEARKIK
ncbi:uncharacterized protein LOC129002238 isoform X2 [Macrosteles quadrilineatus]|uniref:uncharacterized protein LOC129002238 isoform X2 n=1 Tax=Macrosteles quadrilineatus TaxID=74068 RepID=UPI0023E32D8C|nr:uncharacterized protein LOC129002238 isoform X2 [Macrosteles quadrilineatus]